MFLLVDTMGLGYYNIWCFQYILGDQEYYIMFPLVDTKGLGVLYHVPSSR